MKEQVHQVLVRLELMQQKMHFQEENAAKDRELLVSQFRVALLETERRLAFGVTPAPAAQSPQIAEG